MVKMYLIIRIVYLQFKVQVSVNEYYSDKRIHKIVEIE